MPLLALVKGESRVGWRNTGRSGMPVLLQSVSILRADCRGSTLAKEQKPTSGKILSHSWLRRCTSKLDTLPVSLHYLSPDSVSSAPNLCKMDFTWRGCVVGSRQESRPRQPCDLEQATGSSLFCDLVFVGALSFLGS